MNGKPILITGATGAVGPLVVRALYDAGYSIRTFSIDAQPPGMWPDDVDSQVGDITDLSAVSQAMMGIDIVIHMAALLHNVNPSPAMREKYEKINVNGTKIVVSAAQDAGVRSIILFSTIAVYGPSNGAVLKETSPVHPDTYYAQSKLAAEKIVLSAKDKNGNPVGTVLRFGAIYGSRIKGNYERLTHALLRNRFIPVGNGMNRRTLIYDKDVGYAVSRVLSSKDVAGRLYNVTDGRFYTMNEIINAICLALGRKPPKFSLPATPMRIAAGMLERTAAFFGFKMPISGEIIDKYVEDTAVDGSLFQIEVGFAPQFDLQAGWVDAVGEMRRNSRL